MSDPAEVLLAMAETDARLAEYIRASEKERILVRRIIREHQPEFIGPPNLGTGKNSEIS